MNIFHLSADPKRAAQYMCDKHVVKMIVESGQMLSTAHRALDGKKLKRPSKSGKTLQSYYELPSPLEEQLYGTVHVGHPSTQWTMQASGNYQWHYAHFLAMCEEYTYRYDKTHATETKLRGVLKQLPKNIPSAALTQFAQALPDAYKMDDPVAAYRKFYCRDKAHFAKWTKRAQPVWFQPA